MKTARLVALCAACAALVLFVAPTQSADPPKAPSPQEMAKMMAEWQKLTQPGEQHKRLDFFAGKWDAKFTMWWAGPGGPSVTSAGKAETKWVLNKRFLQTHYNGEMVMPDPATGQPTKMPFEGIGTMGYDRVCNVYVGSWMDSMNTQLTTYKGTSPPGSKVITMYGEMDEPMLKMYGRVVKYVWHITGEDTFVFQIIDLAAGDDFKVIEIEYTRAK